MHKFRALTASLNSKTVLSTCAALALAVLTVGCAAPPAGQRSTNIVASDNSKFNVADVRSLSEPSRLNPVAGGFLCWRLPAVDWKRYDKVMIERIQVYIAPTDAPAPVDPSDLKVLLDYFHAALVRDLSPQARMVDVPGPGVLRIKLALTSLVPTNAIKSLAGTAIPYGFVAEMGSGAATGRPAGSTPYLGKTGLEAQFLDGATGAVVAECADTQIGLKYAADLDKGAGAAANAWMNGYVGSFTSWNYAQGAFSKWSTAIASRFAELRAAP